MSDKDHSTHEQHPLKPVTQSGLPAEITLIPGTMAQCYSLTLHDHIVLIDTGMRSSGKKIISFYKKKGMAPDTVLVTHYHPDHIGGLFEIASEFSPRIFVPAKEIDVVKGKEKPSTARSVVAGLVSKIGKVKPVENVVSADNIDVPGIEVVETSGHTPGSTSYMVPELGSIFVGDAMMLKGDGFTVNKAFTLDYDEALKSCDKILSLKPRYILPGHGSMIALG